MPKQRRLITIPVLVVVVFLFFGAGSVFFTVLLGTESSRLPPPSPTTTTTHYHQQSSQQLSPSSSRTRKKNIVILLQQSPVDGKNQHIRLQAIDAGWAQWTILPTSHIAVYAAMDNDDTRKRNSSTSFNHIQLIRHQRHTADRLITENDDRPLENMIHSFATLVLFHDPLQWLIFANDHTFMIPPNLQCLLSTWDANLPIYSGNKLIRGAHRSFNLYFASGGAGVIVSHTALKMFLLALMIGHDQHINTFMALHMNDGSLTQLLTTLLAQNDNSTETVGNGHLSFVVAMMSLYEWRSQGKSLPPVLKVVLSPHRFVILRDLTIPAQTTTTSNGIKVWTWFDSSNILHQEISSYTMQHLSACVPQTMWERSNPGLVLAYCLQAVFNTPFPSTNDSNVISPGKEVHHLPPFCFLPLSPLPLFSLLTCYIIQSVFLSTLTFT